MSVSLSRSAVRKAGSAVRKFARGEIDLDDYERAIDTIIVYRASFSSPMEFVQSRLMEIQSEAGIHGETSQRLKKTSTILNKLSREPALDLSRMQDIGGCRVVLEDLTAIRSLQHQIVSVWDSKVTDYIENPRISGYRAVHVIVTEANKQVEIQLRTKAMHDWAQMVEALSMLAGDNYKQDGDHLVQRYMQTLSLFMATEEAGQTANPAVVAKIQEMQPEVTALLEALREQDHGE